MDYLEFKLTLLKGNDPEILMAMLAEIGFESFTEPGEEIRGYISEDMFRKEIILPFLNKLVASGRLKYHYTSIVARNWNALWESQYDPVIIDGKCMVRAPFHEPLRKMQYDIVIEPKMSFGTAHHETTSLMIRFLMKESLKGKRVLDMGCGTGVLAILAAKMDAREVVAIDNDEWAYANAVENMAKNHAGTVIVIRGEAADIPEPAYDLVVANINRNVLISDIPVYARSLVPQGGLLISGFYEEDLEPLKLSGTQAGLKFSVFMEDNKWACAKFTK
ncbi:MAG: 50S ribosomal protein L11 methyltransferase [Bacteroidota bacterium]